MATSPANPLTTNYAFPLPQVGNPLRWDVEKLGEAITALDALLFSLNGTLSADLEAGLAALVDSSPEVLNTLREFADALGNDPNFATTVTNALAGKFDKAGGSLTGPLSFAAPVSIASAATTDIGAAASNLVTVTGAVTITALGTAVAGAVRVVTFSGAPLLTHNAASLILPGAANIATIAGDVAIFQSLGAGNWKCLLHQSNRGNVLISADQTISGAKTFTNIGFTDTSFRAYVASTLALTLYDSAGAQNDYSYYDRGNNKYGWTVNSVDRMTLSSTGALVCTGDVSGTSDERLKKDWAPLVQGFVLGLSKVKYGTYTRKDTGVRQVGVSAQSLQSLIPEAVNSDEEGFLAVAYGQAAMVACIELAKEIEALKKELQSLKGL